MKRQFLWKLLSILVLFSACGGGKTYIVAMKYVPQAPPVLKVKPAKVAVAPFVDKRREKRDVGIRRRLDGSVDRFTMARLSAAEGVQKAVEKFLRGNGFTVVNIQEWDLKVESLSKIDAELVVGGEVNRLWSRADSVAGRTIVATELEITVYLGKPREGKVLKQGVEIEREFTQIIFSSEKIEETINESLSETIESAFAKLLI